MVALIPMTESEYQMYVEQSIQEYAREHVRAGRWNEEEALQQAKQELQEILPQGLHSPAQYLYMIVDEQLEKRVGVLWFALHAQAGQQRAFVYEVVIFEAFRRHGYATRAFQLLEERAKELGATSIGLHVFGHNGAARQMYEKLGYVATNIQMVNRYSRYVPLRSLSHSGCLGYDYSRAKHVVAERSRYMVAYIFGWECVMIAGKVDISQEE